MQIADLHLTGTSMRMIAVEVGRSAGTISRELARGGSKTGPRARTRYAPYAAQNQAEHRGRQPKASKFDDPLADDQAGFEDNDRSKMIMASGTGRTVTSLRITVAMGC